jgi:putative intracellular protease/amidase
MTKTVLFPLPDRDFDVTEVAVPWLRLAEEGHQIVFATETGATPAADPLLLTGVVFGSLGARRDAVAAYRTLERAPEFVRPLRWADVDLAAVDAVYFAGGHAAGMKPYLESELVFDLARAAFARGLPVAAICHGVLVLARAGVLAGRTTTCLPKYMERSAWLATAWRRGRYFRTYDTYVEDEVRAAAGTFVRGPRVLFARGTRDDHRAAFVVEDHDYLSARWPGDAYQIADKLLEKLSHAKEKSDDRRAS